MARIASLTAIAVAAKPDLQLGGAGPTDRAVAAAARPRSGSVEDLGVLRSIPLHCIWAEVDQFGGAKVRWKLRLDLSRRSHHGNHFKQFVLPQLTQQSHKSRPYAVMGNELNIWDIDL